METYVIRLSLPDRPGALGAVAVRIGAVRGNVVGIAVVERLEGEAIDEVVVELPSPDLLELLVSEIGQVDGVFVELVEPIAQVGADPRLEALDDAAKLFRQLRQARSRRMHPASTAATRSTLSTPTTTWSGAVGPAA